MGKRVCIDSIFCFLASHVVCMGCADSLFFVSMASHFVDEMLRQYI